MNLRSSALACLALLLIFAAEAHGGFTTWNPTPMPSEMDLDEMLDHLYGLQNLRQIDDFGPGTKDQLWSNLGASVTLKARYAAYSQTFGYLRGESSYIFDPLFTATQDGFLSGVSATFSPAQSGEIFRFANKPSGAPIWSSKIANNSDGLDHMVTFEIVGTDAAHAGNEIGHYVLAWEDMRNLGDVDYNDLLVEVSGVEPIPEPATLTLFGLGAAGLITRRIRRRRP